MHRQLVAVVAALAVAAIPMTTMAADPVESDPGLVADIVAAARLENVPVDEALRRWKLSQAAEPLIAAIYDDQDDFAGAYYDRSDGGWRLRVLVSGSNATLVGAVPSGLEVEWTGVAYSFRELAAIRDEIVDLWRQDTALFASVSIYEPSNQVIVGMARPDDELGVTLEAKYGRAVDVTREAPGEPVACVSNSDPIDESRYNCTPWRGGIEFPTTAGSHTNRCTMFFWGKGKSNPNAKYLLTSGHCGDAGMALYHAGDYVGTINLNSYDNEDSISDVARLPATANTTQMNRIYRSSTYPSWSITSKKAGSNQIVGLSVCKNGVGSSTFGERCGTITNANDSWSTGGHIFYGKRANFSTSGGDSGAPVHYGNQIYGIAAQSLPFSGETQYNVASAAENDMAVWLCLNADCTAP